MYQEGSAQHLAVAGPAVQPVLPSQALSAQSAQEQQAMLRAQALKDAEADLKEKGLLWKPAQAFQTKRRLEWGSVQAFFFSASEEEASCINVSSKSSRW